MKIKAQLFMVSISIININNDMHKNIARKTAKDDYFACVAFFFQYYARRYISFSLTNIFFTTLPRNIIIAIAQMLFI